ncbi:transglutaminase domain-containing protein [Nocardiopsis halotolerans]|uniref:transglutaminase domain-containing protein n=1 Tax=Nocardiopsis halotolerans TaxID=124252 RepID=UPI00035F699D|nr:transglutaminase domain-containing protein [Nocardiopsis halotolerans]
MAEIDHRWVESMLATDQARCPGPWSVGRDQPLVGCCRDFALVTVAALRARGVAARTRVGFASYLAGGFGVDHVVAEYWDGGRWVWADTQLDPAGVWPMRVGDIGRRDGVVGAPFASAAQVWLAHRAGVVDVWRYGVAPESPWRGERFVRSYVLLELAHRQGDEVLLWDTWAGMEEAGDGVFDGVARLLVAADEGDGAAERELAAWYARDDRLNPGGWVVCRSPSGRRERVDLVRRVGEPWV